MPEMTSNKIEPNMPERVQPLPGAGPIYFWLAVIAALVPVLLAAHIFTGFTAKAPFLGVDESLVNVARNLVSGDRYGLTFSPTEGGTEQLRTEYFINWGPWYSIIGSALHWLFGKSFELQRAIHPLSLVVITLLAFVQFRRSAPSAAALIAVLLVAVFLHRQWPMIRPDSVVSVFMVLGFLALSAGIRNGSLIAWLGAAFFVSSSVITHPIAWPLVPAVGTVWLIWLGSESGWGKSALLDRRCFQTLGAMVVGGFLALGFYVLFVGRNLLQLFTNVMIYSGETSADDGLSALDMLRKNLDLAWGGGGFAVIPIIAVITAGVFLLFLRRFPQKTQGDILAWVMPPAVLWVFYQAGLMVYPNWHTGYVIAAQVAPVWLIGASVATAIRSLDAVGPRVAKAGSAFMGFTAIILSLQITSSNAKTNTVWEEYARTAVSIPDYVEQALGFVHQGASAWTSDLFGFVPVDRIDAVNLLKAPGLAREIAFEGRSKIAPDYLLFGQLGIVPQIVKFFEYAGASGGREWASGITVDSRDVQYWSLPELFGGQPYRLEAIVTAPPYGPTYVYSKGVFGSDEIPAVAANSGRDSQWLKRLAEPVDVKARKTSPGRLSLSLFSGQQFVTAKSSSTLKMQLEPGTYLVRLKIDRKDMKKIAGIVIATPTSSYEDNISDLGLSVPIAPYLDFDTHVNLVVPHEGGPLYIQHFAANPDVDLTLVFVRPVIGVDVVKEARQRAPVDVPAVASWKNYALNGKMELMDGKAHLLGDASAFKYQVVSPAISVSAGTDFVYLPEIAVDSGNVAVGILDGAQNWLVPPKTANDPVEFKVSASDNIRIVIANNNPNRKNTKQSEFTFGPGRLWAYPEVKVIRHVDKLTSCYPGGRPLEGFRCK